MLVRSSRAVVLRRTLAQAEPVLAAAVSRVAARIPVVATPAEILEVMTMMMSLTIRPIVRPMGFCASDCTGALFFVGKADCVMPGASNYGV